MLMYDELGNMKNEKVSDAAVDIGNITTRLYETLFQEGMTGLEARALIQHLEAQIVVSATMQTMLHQID